MGLVKMFRRVAIGLVLLLGVGYGVAETYAKGFAEKKIAEAAEKYDPAARDTAANVSTPLLWGLITRSTVDRIEISARHLDTGPFLADRVVAVLTGVRLDRTATIKQQEPVVESIERLDMTLEISATEASKILPEGFTFEFQEGKVILRGPGLEISGKLVLMPPFGMRFDPDAGGIVPKSVRVSWKFEDVPFVNCLKEIAIAPGLARVTCSQDNPPARFPP